MKPTRICNWPPRLDVILGPDLCGHARPPRERRRVRRLHPVLRAVARARWRGRIAQQRRFEAAPKAATYEAPVR